MRHNDDIILWPDDSWCYRDEINQSILYKSDEFIVLYYKTMMWKRFIKDNEVTHERETGERIASPFGYSQA